LVDTVTGLADRGIGFRSLQEAIDTTTPGGKLVFHIFAALAEFERDLIRERTSAGLAAARARGRRGGRPSVLTAHKLQVAQEMYRSGQYTVAAIAKTLGSAAPRSTGTSLTPTATNLTVRAKPWTLACECALKEVRSPGESVGKGR
jgi:DNA invertase Pin-like site-specific DNA recombinase